MIIIMIIMTAIGEMMIMAMIMITMIAATMEQVGLEITTWICIRYLYFLHPVLYRVSKVYLACIIRDMCHTKT
jgi:hypothetical protein